MKEVNEHDSNSQIIPKEEQQPRKENDEPPLPKLKLKLNPKPNISDNREPSQKESVPQSSSSVKSENTNLKINLNTIYSNNSVLKKSNSNTGMISSKSSSDLKSLASLGNTPNNPNSELNLVKPLKINLNKNNSSSLVNNSQFPKTNINITKSSNNSNNSNNNNNVEPSSSLQNNLLKKKSFNMNKNSNTSNNDVELGEIIRPKSATSFGSLIPKEQTQKFVSKPGNKPNQSLSNVDSRNSSNKMNFTEKFDPKFKKNKSNNLNPNVLQQFTANQLAETNPLIENLLHQSLPPPPFDPQDPSTIPPEALPFLLSLAHHASQSQFPFPGFDHNQFSQSNETSNVDLNVNVKKRKHDANVTNKPFKNSIETSNTFNEESRSSSSSNSNNGMSHSTLNNSLYAFFYSINFKC